MSHPPATARPEACYSGPVDRGKQPYWHHPVQCRQPRAGGDNTLPLVSIGLAAAAWVTQTHILTAIPAIVIGIVALVRIARDPARYDATSGRVLAILGIVIGAFNVLFIAAAIVLGVVIAVVDIALGP
jgi:hypothetical protein